MEDVLTAEWLVARLEGDTGAGGLFDPARTFALSGAFYEVIPDGNPLPAVRFHTQTNSDVRGATNASARIMVNIDWVISIIHEGYALAKLVPLVKALDNRLHNSNGETAQIDVMQCIRLEPFSLPELADSGVFYRQIGGVYRTVVQKK